jgi:hypothetical protein
MSNVSSTNSMSSTRQTWFAFPAAAALCAFGVVVAPGAAQAAACSNWEFPHGYVGISQTTPNNGFSFRFDSQPAAQPAVAGAPVDASNNKHGTAVGAIAGHHMDVTVTWDDGTTQHYAGDVTGDGSHANGADPFPWQSYNTAFTCADPAPAAANPAPAAKPDTANPAVQSVTILKESTVYDSKGGNQIGGDFFSLGVGSTYDTVQPCADNWCLLKIPGLPGGQHGQLSAGYGWVYSGIDTDENFVKVN